MQPQPGPAPVKIGLGRSNYVAAICVFALLTAIVVAGVRGGMNADESSARIIGYGVAVLFAIPLVLLIVGLRKFLAPRYIVVNPAGLGIQHGTETVMVAWPDILAYGIGYAVAEKERVRIPISLDKAQEMVADRITDATMEALQVSGKRRLVLEIFPAAPHLVDRYPRLRPYWKPQPPPAPGLPPIGWRFALPPVIPIAERIAGALYAWSPPRWAGWIRRPWTS
jgi:hypothetical protein